MNGISISLFGKLRIQVGNESLPTIEPRRAQELLCYLLLHRNRLHDREKLATLFWPDQSAAQSKRYLRQTLWQLHSTLARRHVEATHFLLSEHKTIGINPQASYWLDVAIFEQAFVLVKDLPGDKFTAKQAEGVRQAVELYSGDLLEGWYEEWCIYERDRYLTLYLALLDKLLEYSIAHHEYEAGLAYGAQILRYDRAREQTHCQLMRLHYLAGHRAAAMHQYDECVAALKFELDAPPEHNTVELYRQISAAQLAPIAPVLTQSAPATYHSEPLTDHASQQLAQILNAGALAATN